MNIKGLLYILSSLVAAAVTITVPVNAAQQEKNAMYWKDLAENYERKAELMQIKIDQEYEFMKEFEVMAIISGVPFNRQEPMIKIVDQTEERAKIIAKAREAREAEEKAKE